MTPSQHTREPIIAVLGHVDHGKTTLLDFIRESVVASREAGGITQHIGATDVPFEVVKKLCGRLLEKTKVSIPIRGLLFVDTPGHEAFTTLRRRGGSVADLAILVVDINEGLMPQSIESIQILRQYKTPFVIAANKIDRIGGWNPNTGLDGQIDRVKNEFNQKFYQLVAQLSEQGFDSDMYSKIADFSKNIAIIPVSAKTGEGVPELLMMLVGLTQHYLADQLSVELSSPAKGTILEVKEERGLGTTVDAIIYDGIIKKGDTIVVGARKPIVTKVKALLRPRSLDEMRDPREQFKNVDTVYAAFGVKIVAPCLEGALAGAPVYVGGEELVEKVREEIGEIEFSKDVVGVVVKADTLGGLEAVLKILSEHGVHVKRGMIGKVGKQDVVEASTVRHQEKYLGVVLAFNSPVLDDARTLAEDKNVRIFEAKIIYKLVEDYMEWVTQEREKDKIQKSREVTHPVKFRILPDHVFRQSKPAIVGVEILGGVLRPRYRLMRGDGKVAGTVKSIQSEGESIESAAAGEKVAVSIADVIIGRNYSEGDVVYSFISAEEMGEIDPEMLSDDQKQVLREIKEAKKKRI